MCDGFRRRAVPETRLPAFRVMRCAVVLADCGQDARWSTCRVRTGRADGGVGEAGRGAG